MIRFIEYNEKYYNELLNLQINQWGENSDSDEVLKNISNYNVKLAIDDEANLIGTLIYHKKNANCLYIDMIVIKPRYQRIGIGTYFMQYVLDYAKNNHFKIIECEAIEANNHINSKKLLDNFEFELLESVENYWGNLYPNFHCKECGNQPCTCTMHRYIKRL